LETCHNYSLSRDTHQLPDAHYEKPDNAIYRVTGELLAPLGFVLVTLTLLQELLGATVTRQLP
jgi:succinate dehydrogenase hydrophobic anchor subunit